MPILVPSMRSLPTSDGLRTSMACPPERGCGTPVPLGRWLAGWLGATGSDAGPARPMAPSMIVACGPPGSGTSSFLRSAAIELARRSSPDRLRLAGIDPGGRELAVLEALPHMHLELATSLQHAGPLMDWLAEEAAWRRAHVVDAPAIVLLMDMHREGMPADCRSAWRRLRDSMARQPSAGMHAILAWDGAPRGAGWGVRFGAGSSVGVATPEAPGRPAATWQIVAGGRVARVRVPWLAVQDLDAAVKDIRRADSFERRDALLGVGFVPGSHA